jgi:hypothetical protein
LLRPEDFDTATTKASLMRQPPMLPTSSAVTRSWAF